MSRHRERAKKLFYDMQRAGRDGWVLAEEAFIEAERATLAAQATQELQWTCSGKHSDPIHKEVCPSCSTQQDAYTLKVVKCQLCGGTWAPPCRDSNSIDLYGRCIKCGLAEVAHEDKSDG